MHAGYGRGASASSRTRRTRPTRAGSVSAISWMARWERCTEECDRTAGITTSATGRSDRVVNERPWAARSRRTVSAVGYARRLFLIQRAHAKAGPCLAPVERCRRRSEEHTSELQSQSNLVCRLLLEKKK